MPCLRPLRALLLCIGVAACASSAEPVWAPDAAVQRAFYAHDGPSTVTLYTVINNTSGEGGHTSLMVSGSQRVIWDPAGTWWNPASPERNDVHYGITPRMEEIYVDYHARVSWRVVIQEVEVSRETADQLIAAMQGFGAVPKARCTSSTTDILSSTPAFADTPRSWFPKRLMAHFDTLPGVEKSVVYDDDDDNNQPLLRQQIAAGQDGLR